MSLVLSITDQQNGGDVVATVSGMTGGTVQVYRQSLEDNSTWVAFGAPISANGNVTGTVQTGYYWWRAEQVNGGATTQSNFVRRVVRGSAQALFAQIANAVVTKLQDCISSGGLPLITDPGRVKVVYDYIPEVFPANVPAIAVVANGRKVPFGLDSEMDYKIFPIQIVVAARGTSNTPVRDDDPYFVWQETIESLFLNQRMYDIVKSGIELNVNNEISYPDAVQFMKQNYLDVRVALQVNVKITEPRGA